MNDTISNTMPNAKNISTKLRVAIAFPALLVLPALFWMLWLINDTVQWMMDGVEKLGTRVHNWALQNGSEKKTQA